MWNWETLQDGWSTPSVCVGRSSMSSLKKAKGPALGAVVKGERVLVADQSETALLLESPQAFHGMLRDAVRKSEEALSTSVKDREEKRIKMEELPLQKAKEAAKFVAENYDLLVIEPEGTGAVEGSRPRQALREPPSAAEKARLADDTSRQIGTRDAFYGDLVPFLAALRENHSVPISFATVFGQKCTDPEPRGRAKEDRVRSALDDLVARLRAEAPGYRRGRHRYIDRVALLEGSFVKLLGGEGPGGAAGFSSAVCRPNPSER